MARPLPTASTSAAREAVREESEARPLPTAFTSAAREAVREESEARPLPTSGADREAVREK